MSVIQTIRDKYIGLVIGSIIVALIGFLVMDAMQSNVRSIFGGDQTLLAEVNGQRIEYKKYEALRGRYEENMKSRSKDGSLSDAERSQVNEQVWNDIINETVMQGEIEALGIDLTDKELQDMETGQFPDPMIRQNFTDPNTGIFDAARVSQYISSLGQDKTGEARKQWREFEEGLIKNRKNTKYTELITKGIYFPKFLVEEMVKQKSSVASVNYVQLPYTLISDSSVKISDEEIKAYMQKRERIFKTQDDNARIEYVAFDIKPSTEDTAASLGVLNGLRAAFDSTKDNEDFVAKNSEENIREFYFNESNLEVPVPADVLNSAVGAVSGPFYYNGSYKMVKVLDKKSMPDSVKATHILVAVTKDRTEGQAEAIADSLMAQVQGGMDMAMLASTRSDDQGSAKKGGDLGYFPQGAMVSEFNDACFNGKIGDLKKVKTQFGFHIIRVTDQKDFKPSVKIAPVTKALVAGNATIQAAFAKANEFVSAAKDAKGFDESSKKLGKDKLNVPTINKTMSVIPGLGSAREVARWAFEAKIGDVSPVFNLDDKCIVAKLMDRQEKGVLPSVESIRPQIEGMLIQEKKGQMLIKQYGSKASLEEIAMAAAQTVKTADTVILAGGGNSEIAYEAKVLGAAFNKANLNKKSAGIPGDQGVYFIFVKSQTTGAVNAADPGLIMERMQMEAGARSMAQNMLSYVLKKRAVINDNRSNFY